MLESVKKPHRFLLGALALSIVLFGNAADARTKGGSGSGGSSSTPTVRPWLCDTTGDGSVVGFINSKGNTLIGVSLLGPTDSGGALIQNISGAVGTSTFTVSVVPTATSRNLSLQAQVIITDGTKNEEFLVSPTSSATVGSFVVYKFAFRTYGWPPKATVQAIALDASPFGDASGSVELGKFTFNNTAITTKIPSTAGCR
jgi:hypothetical protein